MNNVIKKICLIILGLLQGTLGSYLALLGWAFAFPETSPGAKDYVEDMSSVTAGFAIYDTMQHIRADVSTICLGQAASMGAFLLSSGTKGKRMALPHSRVLIHQPLGGAQGQATDIEIQAAEIIRIKKSL